MAAFEHAGDLNLTHRDEPTNLTGADYESSATSVDGIAEIGFVEGVVGHRIRIRALGLVMLFIRDELVEPLKDDVFVEHNIIEKKPVDAGIDEVVVVTICFELRGHVDHDKGQAVLNLDVIVVKFENFGFFF